MKRNRKILLAGAIAFMALIVAVFVRGVLSKPSILQSVNLPDDSALSLHTVML